MVAYIKTPTLIKENRLWQGPSFQQAVDYGIFDGTFSELAVLVLFFVFWLGSTRFTGLVCSSNIEVISLKPRPFNEQLPPKPFRVGLDFLQK